MTNAQAIALAGLVTDDLMGRVVDDFGVMQQIEWGSPQDGALAFYRADCYADPDYMERKQ